MENINWVPPPKGFWKINIHGFIPGNVFQGGRSNGIGVVIRDHNGSFVWGFLGSFTDLSPIHAQLWAIHKGMVYVYSREKYDVYIETDNEESFQIIDDNDIASAMQLDIWDALNQILVCFPKEKALEGSDCQIFLVSTKVNNVARYLAEYAQNNSIDLHEVTEEFGRIKELIYIDRVKAYYGGLIEFGNNFSLADVIDRSATSKANNDTISNKFFEGLKKHAIRESALEHVLKKKVFDLNVCPNKKLKCRLSVSGGMGIYLIENSLIHLLKHVRGSWW